MSLSPLREHLARRAEEEGARTALHAPAEETTLTFSELNERIDAWTRLLGQRRLGPGTLVGLATGNALAFPEILFALRSLGAAVLTLEPTANSSAAVQVCRRIGAGWILHRDRSLPGDRLTGAPNPEVALLNLGDPSPPPDGTALVKLTSGTTLNPRGACFTEEALLEGIDHIARGMELSASDRVMIAIPLSHSYGFDSGVLSLAVIGTPLLLQHDLIPAALLRAMQEHDITLFPSVPPLIRALSKVSWPRPMALKRVISASAALSPDVAGEFSRASGIQVQQFFGATECGGATFETHPDRAESRGCVGSPLPGVRVEIVNECVRVHSKANRFALLPDRTEPVPAHVDTGDRATITRDGRIKLLGRTHHVASIGGIQIDLAAIESFFRGLSRVTDAAVVATHDPARGDRILAFVETSGHSSEELLELCRRSLNPREVPGEIQVRERLPRTERGKLDRPALLAQTR